MTLSCCPKRLLIPFLLFLRVGAEAEAEAEVGAAVQLHQIPALRLPRVRSCRYMTRPVSCLPQDFLQTLFLSLSRFLLILLFTKALLLLPSLLLLRMQFLNPTRTFIDTAINRCRDRQCAADDGTHPGQKPGKGFRTFFSIDDFHRRDIVAEEYAGNAASVKVVHSLVWVSEKSNWSVFRGIKTKRGRL